VKKLAAILIAMMIAAPAHAAGIDSRALSCPTLHGVIAQHGYVFIAQPMFGDFIVAGPWFCSGGEYVQTRTVPTVDTPQCPVNYCAPITRFNR